MPSQPEKKLLYSLLYLSEEALKSLKVLVCRPSEGPLFLGEDAYCEFPGMQGDGIELDRYFCPSVPQLIQRCKNHIQEVLQAPVHESPPLISQLEKRPL